MPVNLTNFDAVLKDDMLPGIKQLVPDLVPLLSRVKTRKTGGRRIENPALDNFSQAVGARGESAVLPTAVNDSYLQPVHNLAYQYGKVLVTGPAARASTGKLASAAALIQATKNMGKSFLREINRQMYGDGLGAIAIMPAADDQTTITFSLASAQYATASGRGDVRAFNLNGARIDLIDATDDSTKLLDSRTVSAFTNAGSNTVTLTVSGAAPALTAAGDYLVREDALGSEFTGFAGIINTENPVAAVGNYGGITRVGNSSWQSQIVIPASTPTLAESHIDSVVDLLMIEGAPPKEAWTTVENQRQLAASVASLRRYVNAEDKIDPGFSRRGVYSSGMTVYADGQCTPGSVYIITPDDFALFESQPGMHWREGIKGSFIPDPAGTDAWEATLIWDCVLVCNAPNHQGRVKGLSVTG